PAELPPPVLPALGLLEERQHGVEVPARVAGLRPALVIGPVAAGPDHAVDAARSAEHLPERQGDGAVSHVRARLVAVGPVVARAKILNPLRRVREAWDALPRSARLAAEKGNVGAGFEAGRGAATPRAPARGHAIR